MNLFRNKNFLFSSVCIEYYLFVFGHPKTENVSIFRPSPWIVERKQRWCPSHRFEVFSVHVILLSVSSYSLVSPTDRICGKRSVWFANASLVFIVGDLFFFLLWFVCWAVDEHICSSKNSRSCLNISHNQIDSVIDFLPVVEPFICSFFFLE